MTKKKRNVSVTMKLNKNGTMTMRSTGGYDLRKLLNTGPFSFGLEAQGHIPTIEAALARGESWDEIGRRINWDASTAKDHYERFLSRDGSAA